MNRREFVALGASAPLAAAQTSGLKPKLGIDLFSLRTQKWTPIQYLDYCAARHVQVVHFSEIRFIGSLEPENLRHLREHAGKLGIEVEIGMRSICPTSTMFDKAQGTAEQQLTRMIDAADIVGSPIVRAVLGSAEDRKGGRIDAHIEDTVRVLKAVGCPSSSTSDAIGTA